VKKSSATGVEEPEQSVTGLGIEEGEANGEANGEVSK